MIARYETMKQALTHLLGDLLLPIIRNRIFRNWVRLGAFVETPKLDTQVLQVPSGQGSFEEFIDNRLEVG